MSLPAADPAGTEGVSWSPEAIVARCVDWALQGIVREFPCQLPMVWIGPYTLSRPRDVTPVFYGCYDWHSAVHNHWLLVRACRLHPAAAWSSAAHDLLDRQFSPTGLAAEAEFLAAPERVGFERPYGLAWLLRLTAELRTWPTAAAATWLERLLPLEALAVSRFQTWLPQLAAPNRSGEHQQTAFALGFLYDWSRLAQRSEITELVTTCGRRWYIEDEHPPRIEGELAPHDFLSPALAAADLVHRWLPPAAFAEWLIDRGWDVATAVRWFQPVAVRDYADGKLAHFAGLNFSRSWMLHALAAGLPSTDPRRHAFSLLAQQHFQAGLEALTRHEYAITHWVGSFALYALTQPTGAPS